MKKNISMVWCITILFILSAINCKSKNDSITIRVHFLHGSKPKREYKKTEDRWFGGILGGHAGIEYTPNQILNFLPKARFHVFAKPTIINSRFAVHDTISFYQMLGGDYGSNKKTMITIKISAVQKTKLDSLANAYNQKSPYDYAFFGMRCGAAAYDVLSRIEVVKKMRFKKNWRKIFYPRKVRRRLESAALKKGYVVKKCPGSESRRWEKD